MIETLDFRKKRLASYLAEEYAPKALKWWQQKPISYISTAAKAAENIDPPHSPELVIYYDFKKALILSAFFILMIALIAFLSKAVGNSQTYSEWILFFVAGLVLQFLGMRKMFTRKPQLIINTEGIWLVAKHIFIHWDHLAASYIKEDKHDDSVSYSLIVYYYDEQTDEFPEVSVGLEGLQKSPAFISASIEYWKLVKGNSSTSK